MMLSADERRLYVRWVFANGIAELVGLGGTMVAVAGVWGLLDRAALPVALLLALAVAAVGAVLEGGAVGLLQWSVLRGPLPTLRPAAYALATAVGAFVAWSLGMLPSTLLSASANAGGAAPEPSLALQLLLGAAMGVALGPFIGVPQWLVLRPHLPHAGWWVAANCSAWALGMPMIFLGTQTITPDSTIPSVALAVGLAILAAGLVVGAIHGLWLLWLLRRSAAPDS